MVNFKTTFNFGDTVYLIRKSQEKVWKKCPFCDGAGDITGKDDNTRMCPACFGHTGKHCLTDRMSWSTGDSMTIGEIRVQARCEVIKSNELFSNYGSQDTLYVEQYMCYETGIGSGTLWDEENLFLSQTEADAACLKRNTEE